MYHYDHFIGKSLKFFGPLVRNKGVTKFCDVSEMDDGRTMVKVEVADDVNKPTFWVFIMVKRSFGKKICKVCGKQLHGAALRAHMATQHPVEFARLEARRPSSRAAKRRELSARAKVSARAAVPRSSERDATAPRSSGERKTSPRRPTAPVDATVGKSHSRPDKPSGRATKRAWEEMKQKMSRAAAA